ncbi:MAG: hypothetical protein R3Y63_12375, partial [Eubacteriales bacterium]
MLNLASPILAASPRNEDKASTVSTAAADQGQETQGITTAVLSSYTLPDAAQLATAVASGPTHQSKYYNIYKLDSSGNYDSDKTGIAGDTDVVITTASDCTVYVTMRDGVNTPNNTEIRVGDLEDLNVDGDTINIILDSIEFDGEKAMLMTHSKSDNPTNINLYLKGENVITSTYYGVDVKAGSTVTVYEYEKNASLYSENNTGDQAGIRLVRGGHMIVESGTVIGVSKTGSSNNHSAGIGARNSRDDFCGALTVNGGTVIGQGSIGIGGTMITDDGPITINGGEVVAYGTNIGMGTSGYSSKEGNDGGAVTVTGGSVFAYGGTCGIQTYGTGDIILNGGEITALTAGNYSMNVLSIGTGTGTLKSSGSAVLFRNAPIYARGSAVSMQDQNFIDFTVGEDQLDPFHTYYNSAYDTSTISGGASNIWYGKVYGSVTLKQDFALGAREIYSYIDGDITTDELASCDAMVLDILPSSVTGNGSHNQLRTLKDNSVLTSDNYLTIESDSVLRFEAMPVAQPSYSSFVLGGGVSNVYTSLTDAYADAVYQWRPGSKAPTGGGSIQPVLSDDIIWDSAYYGVTSNGVNGSTPYNSGNAYFKSNTYTILEGKGTYHGLAADGYMGNGWKGYTYLMEAGHGDFWSSGIISITYTNDSTGKGLAAKALAVAGDYTVRIQGMDDRYWLSDGSFSKTANDSNDVSIEFIGQGYSNFTIEPYDITNGSYSGNTNFENQADITDDFVKVSSSADLEANVYISNGQLSLNVYDYVTVNSPFDTTGTTLTKNTDYVLSFKDSAIQPTDGTRNVNLVVTGVGNYTGSYIYNTPYTLKESDGS